MNDKHINTIAGELSVKPAQVQAVAKLLAEDATIPFIARYRKELTGSLDEVEIQSIRDRLEQLAEFDKRKDAILKSLIERELLTDELKSKIDNASTLTVLEDIYLPYRPKRKTRASIAKEKGLEPLALKIFEQADFDVNDFAKEFINIENGINSTAEALQGARDIIAELVNEDIPARNKMRELFKETSLLQSKVIKGKEESGEKFRDYFELSELSKNSPSHRILAIFRGENEGILRVSIQPEEERAIELLNRHFIKAENNAGEQVKIAIEDSYKRLLSVSMETELRNELKKFADEKAIEVFSVNLNQLLMAPPLGRKKVLAVDPAFRTGCKLVCLDEQGKLLSHSTIFPFEKNRGIDAIKILTGLLKEFDIKVIAVGNGTASRETEQFLKDTLKENSIGDVTVYMVNESGASVYSASEVAREEFPEYDVTVRGSISIGRRLMDPLAELVKIDPKSIGVGQYQHDVNQTFLKRKLDDVVISCVNSVGVEVNTASKELLKYVSGLGPKLASNIVKFRNDKGAFSSREELKKVPMMGDKAFEQCAGFLRIRDGENPLDSSAVHPESYHVVEQMAKDLNCSVTELIKLEQLISKIDLNKYVTDTIGLPTLEDIKQELAKPGRDPREKIEEFNFDERVNKITDLTPGMKLPGIVTNITAFGAFVDIGVHQDGLVHISQLSDSFVKDPNEVLKVQQKVTVTVLEVDAARKRISLSLKGETRSAPAMKKKEKFKSMDDKLKELVSKFGKGT